MTNPRSFEDAAVLEVFGASTRNHQEATMSVTTSEQTTSATAIRERTLEITFLEPGAEAYAFTFG